MRITNAGVRWVSAAALALALAGCSQESARFDYSAREARAADFRDDSRIISDEELRSWRYSARGDLRDRARDQRSRRDVTGGLPPEDVSHTQMSARTGDRGNGRDRLAPLHERREARAPRASRRETHRVHPGDTLFSISRRYDVDLDTLARANGLRDPGLIRVGEELLIPRGREPRYAARSDRPRQTRRAKPPRRQARKRRYADARTPRSRDELYFDPLLGDRGERRARDSRGTREEAPGRTTQRPRREDAREAAARRQARISSARARRSETVRGAPPPKPKQRPEAAPPTQIAKAQVPETRTDSPATATDTRTRTADCRDLMKNPPARSGANFRRPAHGLIISRFGPQSDGRRNDGINISVPHGTAVKAAENGVVVYAGDELTGLGKLVLVRHADGWVSAYGHNDRILVERCDTVKRGQAIARAGITGNVSKPQIHFELRKNARPVDPEQHIAGTS